MAEPKKKMRFKWWQIWKYPKMYDKLMSIRSITATYYNDTKFRKITEIIDA